jgi:hypothetical protein
MAADVTVGMTTGYRAGGTNVAPAAPPPAAANGSGQAPPAGPATPQRTEEVRDEAQKGPVMPGLSASDRAAIARATGFYITASGKVTPEGMPPWGFISRYVEQRHAERATDAPAADGVPHVVDGDHVDVTI